MKSVLIGLFLTALNSSAQNLYRPDVAPVEPQIVVARVERMPRVPQPLHIIDWKKTARDYYAALFNPDCRGVGLPAVNLAPDRTHFGFDGHLKPQRSRDPRGEAHACIIPVVGANMLGLDMARLYGMNWIGPTLEWFDPVTKIWSNRPGSGRKVAHVIYEYWPLVIGTLLADQFPKHERFNTALLQQAGTIFQMAKDLGYPGRLNLDQDYQYRDGKWVVLPRRIDSNVGNAASFAWVVYAAYTKTNNPEYLAAAKEAIAWWLSTPGRYEMSHEMGPLVLARLNAEHGCDFDMQRMLDIWFGDSTAFSPNLPEGQVMPWGITAGTRLGGVTCDGLDGACWRRIRRVLRLRHGQLSGPGWLLPAVRYDQRIARTAARYALNAANSCRYFLGIDLDWEHQDHKDWRDSLPNGLGYLFSYEGVRSLPHANTPEHTPNLTPPATRSSADTAVPKHPSHSTGPIRRDSAAVPTTSPFTSAASIGFLGALYNATDVEGIIAWDLNMTDHFAPPSYRTRLLYNPFHDPKPSPSTSAIPRPISTTPSPAGSFARTSVAAKNSSSHLTKLPSSCSLPLVEICLREGSRTLIDGVVVNWRTGPVTSNN